jgi:hypothetical protein
MNSSVDVHYNVARMEPAKKLRASKPLIFPAAGGPTGEPLRETAVRSDPASRWP